MNENDVMFIWNLISNDQKKLHVCKNHNRPWVTCDTSGICTAELFNIDVVISMIKEYADE